MVVVALLSYLNMRRQKLPKKKKEPPYTPEMGIFQALDLKGVFTADKPVGAKGSLIAFIDGEYINPEVVWVVGSQIHWEITSAPQVIKYGWVEVPNL